MNEKETRWRQQPEIGFEHQNVLTVNMRTLDLADLTPQILTDYLEFGHESIEAQLNALDNLRRKKSETPTILVGRLALSAADDNVFVGFGTQMNRVGLFTVEDLQSEYQEYWRLVERMQYIPKIEEKDGRDRSLLTGVWLGLQKNLR